MSETVDGRCVERGVTVWIGEYELRIDWELLKGGEGECGGVDVGEMWCMCGG